MDKRLSASRLNLRLNRRALALNAITVPEDIRSRGFVFPIRPRMASLLITFFRFVYIPISILHKNHEVEVPGITQYRLVITEGPCVPPGVCPDSSPARSVGNPSRRKRVQFPHQPPV